MHRLLAAGSPHCQGQALVVVGAHTDQICASLPKGVQTVINPDWQAGRTGSLQQAAKLATGEDLLVAPVDCPRVPAEVFEGLVQAWIAAEQPPMGWLAPYLPDRCAEHSRGEVPGQGLGRAEKELASPMGAFGHPILIGRDLVRSLADFAPDTPLRALRGRARPRFGVPVIQVEILEDLDTPEDFDRLCALDQERL